MDICARKVDNQGTLIKSVEQAVKEYKEASEALRSKIGNDPAKACQFLLRAGLLKVTGPGPCIADQADRLSHG